jgi:hypothetical protein
VYNKLFTKILDSSIWLESTTTRIVWLTMIAMMDETGFVQLAAVGNVAARARVSLSAAEAAMKTLESPDPSSSDQDHEGRRLERMPGGWMVLNAPKYRAMVTRVTIQAQTRERVRRFREKRKSNAALTPSESESDTRSLREIKPLRSPQTVIYTDAFAALWAKYPRKTGKGEAFKVFARLSPSPEVLSSMLRALEWQTACPDWTRDSGQYG